MALPTRGRVIIETTAGDIDIELWSKETPKTCRNFIALALEGYYDGVIFHRIVPGFLVQTGDKTGTGNGGESFYGEPFEDEIHPRLRFAHRGIVAMANNGTKNSNDSQFFITLDRADELHGKHTLFGRCIGDTVYNVVKIGESEIGENERPVYPPKIKTVRVIDNPFDDIIPRITAAEKRAQQKAKMEAQQRREEAERRKGAKKDVKLLSFGADEDAGGENAEPLFKKKAIVRPDLVDNSGLTSSTVLPDFVTQGQSAPAPPSSNTEAPKEKKSSKRKEKEQDGEALDIISIRERHAKAQSSSSNARQAQIEAMEADIRKLTRNLEDSDDEDEKKKKKPKVSYLAEELAKYSKGRGGKKGKGKRDEGDIMAALNSFRGKLQATMEAEPSEPKEGGEDGEGQGEEGLEVDDDTDFLSHRLTFPKDNEEETTKAERDYEVIDPRQRGARAKEEERERKRIANAGKGRRPGGRR